MTSKQRAYLKSLAMTMDPIFQIGKGSLPKNPPGLTWYRHQNNHFQTLRS